MEKLTHEGKYADFGYYENNSLMAYACYIVREHFQKKNLQESSQFIRGEEMSETTKKKDMFLDLNIEDNSFGFSTTITDALAQVEADLVVLNESVDSIKELKSNCDRLDYALAASSGALCGVIDIFLVGKPGESPLGDITDKWFVARTMDFAKLCHPEKKDFDSLDSALRFLEKEFKIPYDQTGLGDAGKVVFDLNAKNHHFKSLAHNPSLLGLFFSILDQFSNTSHFVSNGQLISLQQADGKWELRGNNVTSKLFCGFSNWIGHLISDVSGSSSSAAKSNRGTGLPSPLWTWTNDIIAIKARLGLSVTETNNAMNELALNIFEKGYDVRFTTTQAIPVFLNELFVRLIYSIRRMFKYFSETPKSERSFSLMWKKCEPFSNATVKRMLTVAHGTFCLVDVGDAVGRSFAAGGGTFNTVEFVLRLNIVGVGRFTISLYGETKRAISYNHAKKESEFAKREIIIADNYMEGLKILAYQYNDARLLTFVRDFEKSDAYIEAFGKTIELAKLRNVPENKVLKNKSDIDRYFGGK